MCVRVRLCKEKMSSPAESYTEQELPPEDPRDKSVLWLKEIWNDENPRTWSSPECVHVCATTQGALNAVSKLTDFVVPKEHHDAVRRFVAEQLGIAPGTDLSTTRVEMAAAVREWACAMNQTFLVATDRGGGQIAEVWRADGYSGTAQVCRLEAQQIFRNHGLLVVIDLVHLKSVSLLLHPDKRACFKELTRFDAHARVGAPPVAAVAAVAVAAAVSVPEPAAAVSVVVTTELDARVAAALSGAAAALAAVSS